MFAKVFWQSCCVREDRERLANAVKTRRNELELRQDQMAARGGPSTTKMTEVEQMIGPTPSAMTLRKLDDSLGWERGSAARVLAGGDPVLATRTDLRSVTDQELLDEIRTRMGARHDFTTKPSTESSTPQTHEDENAGAGGPRNTGDLIEPDPGSEVDIDSYQREVDLAGGWRRGGGKSETRQAREDQDKDAERPD